jgi:hypothetical protein
MSSKKNNRLWIRHLEYKGFPAVRDRISTEQSNSRMSPYPPAISEGTPIYSCFLFGRDFLHPFVGGIVSFIWKKHQCLHWTTEPIAIPIVANVLHWLRQLFYPPSSSDA